MTGQNRRTAASWARRGTVVLTLLGALGALALHLLRAPASTAVGRGERVAESMGCLGCHSNSAHRPWSNPGAAEGLIPPLDAGGPFLFFVQSEVELREWILEGRPRRLAESSGRAEGRITMPAYRGHLDDSELDDLVAFVQSVALDRLPVDPDVLAGRRLAEAQGCFACHGVDGRASLPNPGSFKGVIPPWNGDDYPKLVKHQGELREWIERGTIERFDSNPLARFFLDRQAISMPAYGDLLDEAEVDALVAYVEWARNPDRSGSDLRRRTPPTVDAGGVVARGEHLYRTTGCAMCHGQGGSGGVPNAQAPGGFVPALDLTAERLQLFEEEEIEAVLHSLEQGLPFERIADDPPFDFFDEVLDAYRDLRAVIVEGRMTPGDAPGVQPAMRMPAWSERLGATSGPLSEADIDAIVAYLLTLS